MYQFDTKGDVNMNDKSEYDTMTFIENLTKIGNKYRDMKTEMQNIENFRNDIKVEIDKANNNGINIGILFPITIELNDECELRIFQSGHVYFHEGNYTECIFDGYEDNNKIIKFF